MTVEALDLPQVLMDILVRRVSVRRYEPDPISDEQIRLLCEAAGRAPSGENFQSWRFIVVRDPDSPHRTARREPMEVEGETCRIRVVLFDPKVGEKGEQIY